MTIEEIERKLRNGEISEPTARNEAHKLGYSVRVVIEEYPDRTQQKTYQFLQYRKIPKPSGECIEGPSAKSLLDNKRYHCARCGKESNKRSSGPCTPSGKKGRPYNEHDWKER